MKKNIFTLIIASVLLFAVPICFTFIHWQWSPTVSTAYLKGLFVLTQTAGNPWSALTSIVLALWFCWCLKLPLEQNIKLLIILILMVVFVVLLKSILKELTEEPRPFVVWLSQLFHLTPHDFYHLNKTDRAAWIAQHATMIPDIASWQIKYWQTEVSYAFPSGHTLFSASWAILASLLLWQRRKYMTCIVLIVWQMGVSVSRLMLGMHWPCDIFFSILFAVMIAVFTYWLINKCVFKNTLQRFIV